LCEANESKVAAIESELAESLVTLKKHGSEQADTKVRLSSDIGAVQTNRQASLAERDEKKTAASMETAEQAGTGVEEELQRLTAEARKPGFFDLRQEEVEAATFPNATDRVVFYQSALRYGKSGCDPAYGCGQSTCRHPP
jgi:hypothetical protein